MEELNDFFNLSKNPTQRVQLRGPQTGGAIAINKDELEELFSKDRQAYARSYKGTDYAERYKQLDLENSLQQMAIPEELKTKEMLDDLTSLGDVNRVNDLVEDTFFYKKFSIQSKSKMQLPINDMKEKILSTIDQSPVTIIEGPTGCGKTTQIPHWILQDCYNKRQTCNIVVTQPRRIAAISVAKRVCEENNYEMSTIVGYQVGLDSKVSKDTRLQYVTTGVLLQKLVSKRNMENITHVILDEVHERDQEMDFLFIVVKKLRTANVKIVLMSATFDLDVFANYFRFPSYDGLQTPPILKIESPRMYDIKVFYLNALSVLGQVPEIEYTQPGISKDMNIFALKILNAFEFIDSTEEKNADGTSLSYMPSVLIFLPGIFEIEELYKVLSNQKLRDEIGPEWSSCKWWLVPLHSTITSEEQQQVFKPTPPGYRKIILATNIAESSITVPDIKYVIDFCLTKVLMSNPETNFSTLRMTWASQANLKQRAGRAGRVREGRVYRMILQDFYNRLDKNCIPEMQRCPLNNLVLNTKMLDMGPPVSILALAMDPPDLSNITRTILGLKQVGALLKTVSGEMSLDDGDITYMGRIMAKLPLDIRFSKLIMLGYIFGLLDDCIVMACGMSVKNIFSTPFQNRMGAFNSKLAWADGSTSDCLALLNVYEVYTHLRNINYFSSAQGGEKAWAKTSFLQMHSLRELISLVTELKHRLARESIIDHEKNKKLWNDIDRPFVLKLLLSGAFYPFYFTLTRWGECQEREATRLLCGRNPRNTIYFSGMDSRQPGIIYSDRIKQLLSFCPPEDMTVSFDGNSSKAFVTFANRESLSANKNKNKKSQIPGQVILPVYKAIKCRQMKIETTIPVMPVEKSMEYATSLGLYKSKGIKEWEVVEVENDIQKIMQPRIPDVDENYIHVVISNLVDCSHFWCNYSDQTTQDQLNWLHCCLNKPLPYLTTPPRVGQICAAPYSAGIGAPPFYYRARIEKVTVNNLVWVFFIDYGNSCSVALNTLKALGPQYDMLTKIKALAFECVLSETAPSVVKDQRAIWTEKAQRRFAQLTAGKKLLGKVYSVSMGVVSLELFSDGVSVNKILVEEGHAQEVEESYISRLNRDIRDTAQNLQPVQKNALNKQQRKEYSATVSTHIRPPEVKDCKMNISLKGPYSPLETHLLNLMYAGKDKTAHIEWSSVNSVLLTTDPQDLNDRLLVSASIDQSSSGGNLVLRHTTMLPNIRGLPTIVTLMFSPVAELKPDSTLCHYAAVLGGLGHVDGSPLYPEQDILVPVDFELDRVDLQNINKLRYHMDFVLFTELGQESPMNQLNIGETTREIKSLFETLMTRNRRWREPTVVSRPWQWAADYAVDEAEATNFIGERAIFPPHNALDLRHISPHELMKMALENKKAHDACNGMLLSGPTNQRIECILCRTDELTLTAMRLHLNSRLHKERESDLPQLDEEEKD